MRFHLDVLVRDVFVRKEMVWGEERLSSYPRGRRLAGIKKDSQGHRTGQRTLFLTCLS